MFNYDCVSFSSSIVNVPYVIILSVSICISSLLVWISINTFKTQWEGMGDVGSARYEPALLPPCPTIRVLSYSN